MNKQKVLLTILALVVVGAGYFFYQNSQSPSGSETNPQAQIEFQNKLAELQRLRELKLDTSIFQDKFFQSLKLPEKPSEQPLTPGRPNPFFPP